MTNKSFRVILAVILFSFSIWLLYPREVVFAPEMEITVLSNDKQVVAKANAKRTYSTYLDEEGIVDNFANADENGKVKFESVKGRVPLIAQWIKFVTTILSPHNYPSSGGRILARDSQNHFLWKDVGYKNEDCCPTEIVIEMQKSEMYDSNLGINK